MKESQDYNIKSEMKKQLHKIFVGTVLLLLTSHFVFGQLVIKGPTCITTGTVYEYIVSGDTSSITPFQICVSGGTIVNSPNNDTCINQQKLPSTILVTWNSLTLDTGALLVSSSLDTFQLPVSYSQALQPGLIDSNFKVQFIDTTSSPVLIMCAPASEGSCSPVYSYQWQQSSDGIVWTNITAANDSNLNIASFSLQKAYYRRQVTETVSGTIAYSDIAAVFVSTQD